MGAAMTVTRMWRIPIIPRLELPEPDLGLYEQINENKDHAG